MEETGDRRALGLDEQRRAGRVAIGTDGKLGDGGLTATTLAGEVERRITARTQAHDQRARQRQREHGPERPGVGPGHGLPQRLAINGLIVAHAHGAAATVDDGRYAAHAASGQDDAVADDAEAVKVREPR